MALVQRHLTPAEWDGMHAEFSKHYTTADMLFALPWVIHEIPDELRPAVTGFIGRVPVLLCRMFLAPGFAWREQTAFRYAAA